MFPRVLETIFFGLKYFNSFMRIQDEKKFGSGMEKSLIHGKHPGSAALVSTWEIQNKKSDRKGRFKTNTKTNVHVSWEK
jgi:hypothetical protein